MKLYPELADGEIKGVAVAPPSLPTFVPLRQSLWSKMNIAHQLDQSAPPDGDADILLVEDDATDAELTLRALQECGFAHRVEHVSDGAEALDYIAFTGIYARNRPAPPPKLILLDLSLNKIGGLQVLRQLKADERTKGIPVVVLTGSKLTIEMLESYKLGVNSYVIKPTSAIKFAEVVAAIGHYWLAINEPPPR